MLFPCQGGGCTRQSSVEWRRCAPVYQEDSGSREGNHEPVAVDEEGTCTSRHSTIIWAGTVCSQSYVTTCDEDVVMLVWSICIPLWSVIFMANPVRIRYTFIDCNFGTIYITVYLSTGGAQIHRQRFCIQFCTKQCSSTSETLTQRTALRNVLFYFILFYFIYLFV